MIEIRGFQGEIPLAHPRMLPNEMAAYAMNARVEGGDLTPFRRAEPVHTFGGARATFLRHEGAWLGWAAAGVSAIPGPVETSRLYIFGDGAPKVRVDAGTTYNLAVPRPTGRLAPALRSNPEWIRVNGRNIRLRDGETVTGGGWNTAISVRAGTAKIKISHRNGVTVAAAAAIINGLAYRNTATGTMIPSLKIARITSVKDSGGQTLDEFRSKIGSDTRKLENVGTTISVAGTDLTYEFPAADPQDATDTADQNDPPTLTTTPLNPVVPAGNNNFFNLFAGTTINTIEAGQSIVEINLRIEGLNTGIVDEQARTDFVYTYTYVTVLDEESAPANLSKLVGWSDGQSIRIGGFLAPPGGRGIDRIRVYRSETGASGQTDLYLIAERPIGFVNFDDDVSLLPAMEPIPSLQFDPPNANLRGAVAMPNGIIAAFRGRNIYFCEPFQPHAWPETYMLRVNHDIVGLAALGTSLAILTKGQPYVAQGTHPSQMRLEKIEGYFPCVAAASIVDMGYFAAYASPNGLVTIDPNGATSLVSSKLFGRREWDRLRPGSFQASHHDGRYIFSYRDPLDENRRNSGIIDLSGKVPTFIRTPNTANAFWHDEESSQLFYISGAAVREVDPVTGPFAQMRWRSKEFIGNRAVSYSSFLIDADRNTTKGQLLVKIFADDKLIATISEPNRIVRVPDEGKARKWQIEIATTMRITAVYLAGSADEIMQAAA